MTTADRRTLEGQLAEVLRESLCGLHVAHTWEGGGWCYRLAVRRGAAVVERSRWSDRGPWRRMPYPQHLVDELARLACGDQWREIA